MPRKKSDTVSAQIRAMQNAALPDLEPPKHVKLREQDWPFWTDILRARARDDWQPYDLTVVAQLARCQYDIERESEHLYAEGSIVENARGTQVMNPRVTVLEQLARREMALMRSLRMTGQTVGDPRDLSPSRNIENKARKAKSLVGDETHAEEELLA
jgi:hypothetical protein